MPRPARHRGRSPACGTLPPALLAVLLALAAALAAFAPPAAAQPLPIPGAPADEAPAEPAAAAEEEGTERRGALLDLPPDPLSASAWRLYGTRLLESAVLYIPNVIRAVVVLLAFWLAIRLLTGLLRGVLARRRSDPTIVGITSRLAKYVLLSFAIVMALGELGFNVGSLIAGLGILGLAVGLAAQESLGNVVAGLTILWDRPYRVGDNVTIAGTFGRVQEIGLRATRILTVERLDAFLPNREVVKEKIVNHTANPQLRLGVPLSIAYKEDTREARRALLAAVTGHRLIREEPLPAVVVTALAESGVELELRAWLRDPHEEREALFELTELAKIALDEAGIEIPFPQRTIHFAKGTFPSPPSD
ncbi:MAG TPA: mechanosensitive ion channel family protein [Thermoanaerobaculia bacterium]